jgi:hypothetical protein
MKNHPLDGDFRVEDFLQVPGNSLAFAVLVGRQIELLDLFEGGF